jgi:hypothetical protein
MNKKLTRPSTKGSLTTDKAKKNESWDGMMEMLSGIVSMTDIHVKAYQRFTRKRVLPRNRIRENRTSGTVRGVPGNRHSYREMCENYEKEGYE